MSYDISIARLEGDENVAIQESEWVEYATIDPELDLSESTDEDSKCWEWNGHPLYRDPMKRRPWFQYWKGQINTKNPDREVAVKMFKIATALHAKVIGQDGEFYDEDGDKFDEQTNAKEPVKDSHKAKHWWHFW
jgi:hypothetical protein